MKKLLLACLVVTMLCSAFALPSFDPFADASASGGTTYPQGSNVGGQKNALGDRWYIVNSGATAANQTYLTNSSLTFPGLPALGGGALVLRNVSGPGARMFVATASGGFLYSNVPVKAYYSMLLKVGDVTHLSATGDYFWGFNNQGNVGDQNNQPGDLHARVYLRKSGSGYQVGLAKTSAITWDPAVHATGETLFLVGCYEIVSGATTDDVVRLWVNPSASSFGAPEPIDPPTLFSNTNETDELTYITSFTIENRSTTTPDLMLVDDFRLATNWCWATGGPGLKLAPPTTLNVTYTSNFSLTCWPLGNGTSLGPVQWLKDGVLLTDGPDVSGSTTTNLVINNAVVGGVYSVVITNGISASTNSTLVSIIGDPRFLSQPADTNAAPGAIVSFSVAAIGTPSLSYRWQQNGVPLSDGVDAVGTTISGAGTPTLVLSTIGLADSGSTYTCAVTNGLGNGAISSSATLTVNDPAIVVGPQNTTTNYLTTATFTVNAAGSGTLTYHWQLNNMDLTDGASPSGSGATISGSATPTLRISGVTYLDRGGNYSVWVKNGAGSLAYSLPAILGVNDPYFSTPPTAQTNMAGTTATFTCVGAGSGTLSYQWYLGTTQLADNATYTGTQAPTLSIASVSDALAGTYSVVVTGDGGSMTNSAALIVLNPVTITSQPMSRVIRAGDNVAFVVGVTATLPTYQWLYNGSPMTGATNASYLLNSVQAANAGSYSVVVANAFNRQTSSLATLTVSAGLLHLYPTNLVVVRVGDGAQALSGARGNTLYVDQFTPSGQYQSSIMVPDSGPSSLIVGGSGNDGATMSMLSRSTNQLFLNFAGYNVARPFSGTLSADAALAPRAVGAINGLGYYSLRLANAGLYDPSRNFRGVVSDDGLTNFWTSGSAAGVKYLTPSMSGSGVPQVSPSCAVRGLGIFNGDLYYLNVSAGQKGLYKFTGLPTVANSSTTALWMVSDTSSPTEFALSPDGLTLYVTDDSTAGGIQRWDNVGGVWALAYTLVTGADSTIGARGLLVDFTTFTGGGASGSGAVIYATTAESSNNRLITITDSGASSAATVLASAGPNQLFRGVQFGPVSQPVTVAVQPSTQTAVVGGSATFTAVAQGTGPLAYQWQRFGTNLPGATLSSLTLSNLQVADSTTYTVVVSNDLPSAASASAALTVSAGPPVITAMPQSRSVSVGANVGFAVQASGTEPLSYQWSFHGSAVAGATGPSFALSNVQLADAGTVGLTITNLFGATQVTVSLSVSAGPISISSANLVVARVGDGVQMLDNLQGNTLSFDQYTPAGSYVSTVVVPDSGPAALIVAGGGGNGLSEAVLSRSANEQVINFTGYHVDRPFAGDLAASGTASPRAIGALNGRGFYSLVLTNTALYTPNRNIRGAISTDGLTQFWTAGSDVGVKYVTPNMVAVGPQVTDNRSVRAEVISNGNLWFSSTAGLFLVGGLPTTTSTGTLFPMLPTGTWTMSPNDFAISPDGRTIYVADDRSADTGGGIQRWDDFSLTYTLATGSGSKVGARGLMVDFSNFPGGGATAVGAVLYATTGESANNRLLRIVDTGSSASATVLATAGANQLFRGLSFGPALASLSLASQPQDHTIYPGGSVTFTVGAAGDAPFAYQWKFYGTNLPGATQSALALSNVQAANTGGYSCTVSDLGGATVNSRTATLSLVAAPTTPYATRVLNDHPVAYWRLNEAPGAPIAHDYVGGHDGTYNSVDLGQAGYSTNDLDTAAFFGTNGLLNSYVGNIPLDLSGAANAELSVEAWVLGSAQPQGSGIVALGYGSGGEQFALDNSYRSGLPVFRFIVRDGSGTSHNVSGTIGADGNWHHVVGVVDQANGYVLLYVDGAPNATNTIPVGAGVLRATTPASIGARESANTFGNYDLNSQATIDEVAVYGYALTPGQVAAHYQLGTGAPAVTLSWQYLGGQWQLVWSGDGTLQAAPEVTGTYTNLTGATSPFPVTPTAAKQFFRVKVR